MRRVGKVINIEKNKVFIVTKNNEFVELQRNHRTPVKGELYAGEVYKKPHYIRNIILTLIFFASIIALIQYINSSKPVLNLVVKMNASFRIKINKSNEIVKVEPINSKGKAVTSNIEFKNNSINDGLKLILDECIKQNILNEKFIKSNKRILVYISNNYDNIQLDLSSFKKHAKKNNFTVIINNNGEGRIE